jgi:hypothetical protein
MLPEKKKTKKGPRKAAAKADKKEGVDNIKVDSQMQRLNIDDSSASRRRH